MNLRSEWSEGNLGTVELNYDGHPLDTKIAPRFGDRYWQFSRSLRDRFRLQEETQATGEDEVACIGIGEQVNDLAINEGRPEALSKEELEAMTLATKLTDIGKTGPGQATKEQQRLIAKMYATETEFPKPPHLLSLREFLELSVDPEIKNHLEGHLATLAGMGLAKLNTRDFINLHAEWTWEIIADDGAIPQEAKVTAALHHLLDGVNPDGLVDLSSDKLIIPSLGRAVDFPEIFTILLDKYQARRRFVDKKLGRKRTHFEQIAWLQNFFTKPGLVKLSPYPDWLEAKILGTIDLLEEAGPFPQYFEIDRVEKEEPSLAAK